ncbi:hypothetical protein C5S35_00040 [Candidatus Methanophagaceae archaeon]|nr:hypothetical protein C5S35_00040 [Methanophagales archaeon]
MDKREERSKSAIIGIAVAAIVIVSVTVAMVSSTGAYSTGGLCNISTNQTAVQSMLIGHDLDFSQGGGNFNEKGAGSVTVFTTSANLTANLSTESVDPGYDFTITGTAAGSQYVEILIVSPKGYGGSNIEGGKLMYYASVGVSATDGTFSKKISLGDDVDIGYYLIMVLSPGSDGLWSMYGYETLYNPDNPNDYNSALGQYTLWGRTQEDMLVIIEDIIYTSDDLLLKGLILVGEKEPLILNPVADAVAGDTLEVTGESIWSDGSFIWLTVEGSYSEIEPKVAYVKDNTFNATFDTTGVPSGTYTVTATDGYRYIKSTLVNITAESYVPTLFDTGEGSYPGIMGTHEGTITIHKIGYETQLSGYESRMPLMLKAGTKAVSSSTDIVSSDRDISHYTVQEKIKEEYAGHLEYLSVKPELTMMNGRVQIKADTTEVLELTVVKLTVTGISDHIIHVKDDTLSKNAYFPAGIYDNPRDVTCNSFTHTIDDDGTRTYAVVFNDTGAYTIKVIDLNESDSYDTVDIIVTDRQVTFDVPDFVQIAENFTIRGTANTSDTGTVDTVTVAVDDEVVQGLDCIVLEDNGEFEVEIDTSAADAPAAFASKAPGTVQLKAYIDRPAESDYPAFVHTNERADGSTTVFIQNEKGGGIGISASELIMCMNVSIILTIHAAADHNVSVTTADPAHTVLEYNRYDFTGTSSNIINVVPADTISIPTAIGDCDSQSKAKNIHGVWETMDADGTSKFAVHFSDPGTYKITATDYGTGYPTATRLDEEEIEITVTGDNVTFNVPSIVTIGERFTIKGTTSYGDTVTVAVNDEVVQKLYQIVIDENGKFEEDIDTSCQASPSSFMIPGSVRLKAYIDYDQGTGTVKDYTKEGKPLKDEGTAEIFMVSGWLTASLSTDSVEPGGKFWVSGTAKGSKSVSIMIVAPKGYSGSSIEGGNGMYYATTSVTVDENIFYKKISVGDDIDTGRYLVVVLSADGDGLWGKSGYRILYNPDKPEDTNTALGQYTLTNRTQEEMLAIFEDLVFYSDDDIWMGHITVAHEGTIIVQKMYTYACPGTGGHSEYAAFYDLNDTLLGEGRWNGYQDVDSQYIMFDDPFTLELGKTYNYTIKTGSYPQIIHKHSHTADNGTGVGEATEYWLRAPSNIPFPIFEPLYPFGATIRISTLFEPLAEPLTVNSSPKSTKSVDTPAVSQGLTMNTSVDPSSISPGLMTSG